LDNVITMERSRSLAASRELDDSKDRAYRDAKQINDLRRFLKDAEDRESRLEHRLRATEERARASASAALAAEHGRHQAEMALEEIRKEIKVPFVVPALVDTMRYLSGHASKLTS
jgi:hypothetical protein